MTNSTRTSLSQEGQGEGSGTPSAKTLQGAGSPPRSLRTCSAGHETCWPESCPACRSYALDVRIETHSEAMKAYWKRRKAGKGVQP